MIPLEHTETLGDVNFFLEETKSIPVIAVSANAMEHDIKSALDAGFKNYLTKPVNLSLLAETIQSTLHPTL